MCHSARLSSLPVRHHPVQQEMGIGEFYPYIMSSVLLVLPIDISEDGPILHLDTPARPCCEFVV